MINILAFFDVSLRKGSGKKAGIEQHNRRMKARTARIFIGQAGWIFQKTSMNTNFFMAHTEKRKRVLCRKDTSILVKVEFVVFQNAKRMCEMMECMCADARKNNELKSIMIPHL